MENRPLEKLVVPVRKSLRWRLPGGYRAGGRTGHDAPPGAAAKHVVSGALQRASGRDIVHQRPPKRLKGWFSAAFCSRGRRPGRKRHLAFTAPV